VADLTGTRIVLCTLPNPEKAAEIAKVLVEEQLAACVNLVPGVVSIYRWKGELCNDTETLAVIKTSDERYAPLARRITELHPYEVPEIIALPIVEGHAPYLAWILESTR
jgi:periplasmic divalent cation tolerance protein